MYDSIVVVLLGVGLQVGAIDWFGRGDGENRAGRRPWQG